MAGLTVETGSGSASADSYVSRTAANTYFANHGAPALWTALSDIDDGGRDSALRYATRFIDSRYSFRGTIVSLTQALSLPTTGNFDELGRNLSTWATLYWIYLLPATCELALYHATAALNASLARGGLISSVSLGGGAVAVSFADYAPAGSTYPFVDELFLKMATIGGGRQSRLIL